MRLHLTLSANREPVPFAYQHFLTGALHKWLGQANPHHDQISLYSLSWLDGSRMNRTGTLDFPHGARFFLSFHNDALVETLVNGALTAPDVCCGMRVVEINQQTTPIFGTRHTFKVGSAVLIKAKAEDGRIRYLLHNDPAADAALTATLRHKMDAAQLDPRHRTVTVAFDKTYRNPKTKLVTIKNIHNRANICPVHIEGTPEALQFAWNVGIGNGTGSGFGSLL